MRVVIGWLAALTLGVVGLGTWQLVSLRHETASLQSQIQSARDNLNFANAAIASIERNGGGGSANADVSALNRAVECLTSHPIGTDCGPWYP